MAASVEALVSPWNACPPVTISYNTDPKLKMSERASTFLPSACSGDMYATVPTILPSSVAGRIVSVASSSLPEVGSVSFARPKSRTFTSPCSFTMMFPGLRSRWTMPAACARASASAI